MGPWETHPSHILLSSCPLLLLKYRMSCLHSMLFPNLHPRKTCFQPCEAGWASLPQENLLMQSMIGILIYIPVASYVFSQTCVFETV